MDSVSINVMLVQLQTVIKIVDARSVMKGAITVDNRIDIAKVTADKQNDNRQCVECASTHPYRLAKSNLCLNTCKQGIFWRQN